MSYKSPTGVKIIGGLKLLTALLLITTGLTAFHFMNHDLEVTAKRLLVILDLDPKNKFLDELLSSVTNITPKDLRNVGIATFIYAALYVVEGVGLLRTKRWAEYLTIVITASLLPFEGYEVYLKASWLRITALVVNLIIVIYLVYVVRRGKKHRHK